MAINYKRKLRQTSLNHINSLGLIACKESKMAHYHFFLYTILSSNKFYLQRKLRSFPYRKINYQNYRFSSDIFSIPSTALRASSFEPLRFQYRPLSTPELRQHERGLSTTSADIKVCGMFLLRPSWIYLMGFHGQIENFMEP